MYLNVYYCEDCDYEWETESETKCSCRCEYCNQETEPVVSADLSQYTRVVTDGQVFYDYNE